MKKTASVIALATLFFSGCSIGKVQTIELATATSTMPVIPMEATYDENYMKDCKEIFPTDSDQQAEFKGLRVGYSTTEGLAGLFGAPLRSSSSSVGVERHYLDPSTNTIIRIYTTNNLINRIEIGSDIGNDDWLSAREIFEEYGCPDLIFATTVDDHSRPDSAYPNYGATILNYPKAGFRVVFFDYPISYTHSPLNMVYERPRTLDSILREASNALEAKISVLVSFSDAIK